MRYAAALVALCALALPVTAAQTCPEGAVVRESALWNPGPQFGAGIHSSNSDGGRCTVAAISTMDGAAQDGNAPGICTALTCDGKPIAASDGSCPSYYHVTYGWTSKQFGVYPGWAIWNLGDSFRLFNHSNNMADPCQLREVSVSYIHYPDSYGYYGLRKQYELAEVAEAHGVFSARLGYTSEKPRCAALPTGYITSDFGVKHLDANGVTVRTDTIGVLIYNQSGWVHNPSAAEELYWFNGCERDAELCQALLRGRKLGHAPMSPEWQRYDIEFKALLKYLPKPPTSTVRSVVFLWEVYSSSRGADIEFDVRDMGLQVFR